MTYSPEVEAYIAKYMPIWTPELRESKASFFKYVLGAQCFDPQMPDELRQTLTPRYKTTSPIESHKWKAKDERIQDDGRNN